MAFKKLDPEDFVVSMDSLTGTAWSDNVPTLTSFFTSSIQSAGSSGNYYLSIFQTASTDSTAAVQFDIIYSDKEGSGSAFYNNAVIGNSYSKTMYGSYRSLILEDENSNFVFGSSVASGFNNCGVLITSSTAI